MRRDAEEYDKDADWKAGRRERQERMDGILDPLRVTREEMATNDAMREDYFKSRDVPNRESRQDRAEQIAARGHGPMLNKIDRDEEFEAKNHPARLRGIGRKERSDEARTKVSEYQGNRANRMNFNEDTMFDANEYLENVDQMLFRFKQSGNPADIMAAYELLPDGHSVEIVRNEDGTYNMMGSGGSRADKVTFDELVEYTDEFFRDHPLVQDAMRRTYGEPGYGGYGGMSGRGKMPAVLEETHALVRNMSRMPEYRGYSQQQLFMEAHAMASRRGGVPPQQAIQDYYQAIVTNLIRQKDVAGDPVYSPEEAEKIATDMTMRYEQQHFSMGGMSAGTMTRGFDSGMGGMGEMEIPRHHVQRLLANPDDYHVEYFNRRYGPNAAQRVIQQARQQER